MELGSDGEDAVAHLELIELALGEVAHAALGHEVHDDVVAASAKNAFLDGIDAWGILVGGVAHIVCVDEDGVGVFHGAKAEHGFLSSQFGRQVDAGVEPVGAVFAMAPVGEHIDGVPRGEVVAFSAPAVADGVGVHHAALPLEAGTVLGPADGVHPVLLMILGLGQLLVVAGELGQHVVRHPCLHLRAAHGRVDDAHGHASALLQLARHKVADAAHLGAVLRCDVLPGEHLHVGVGTHVVELVGQFEVADVVVGIVLHLVGHHVHAAADGELHVGLSRAEEDIAHEHVVHVALVYALEELALLDFEGVGPAGLELLEGGAPGAILLDTDGGLFAGHAHRDPPAGCARAPNGHFGVALHDHAVGKEARHLEVGVLGREEHAEHAEPKGENCSFHFGKWLCGYAIVKLDMLAK